MYHDSIILDICIGNKTKILYKTVIFCSVHVVYGIWIPVAIIGPLWERSRSCVLLSVSLWIMSNKRAFHYTTAGCNCVCVCDCITDLLSSGTLLPRTQLSCSGTDSGVVCSSAGRAAGGAGLTFLRLLRELWFSAVTDGCCLCGGGTGGSVEWPCWWWLDGCSAETNTGNWVNQWRGGRWTSPLINRGS